KKKQKKLIKTINEKRNLIKLLIEYLLHLSQLEKEDSTLHKEEVQIDSLLENVMHMIAATASSKAITIQTDIQPQIVLQADEEKLKQLLLNLLTNAISYTPPHA